MITEDYGRGGEEVRKALKKDNVIFECSLYSFWTCILDNFVSFDKYHTLQQSQQFFMFYWMEWDERSKIKNPTFFQTWKCSHKKMFGPKKNVRPKCFSDPKLFRTNIFFDPHFFLTHIFFLTQNFWTLYVSAAEFFRFKFFFRPIEFKKLQIQNKVRPGFFLN